MSKSLADSSQSVTLMLGGFNQNLLLSTKRLKKRSNLLEQQTYIQRNGELYEYLTDEEKRR